MKKDILFMTALVIISILWSQIGKADVRLELQKPDQAASITSYRFYAGETLKDENKDGIFLVKGDWPYAKTDLKFTSVIADDESTRESEPLVKRIGAFPDKPKGVAVRLIYDVTVSP